MEGKFRVNAWEPPGTKFFVRVGIPWAGPASSLTYVFDGVESVVWGRWFEAAVSKIQGSRPEMLRMFWELVQQVHNSSVQVSCTNRPEDALRFAADLLDA